MGGAGERLRTPGEGETTRGGRLARRGAPTRRRFCGEMAHGGGDGLTDEDEPRACRRCGGGQAPLCLRRAAAEVLQLLSPLLRRCERRVVQHDSSKGGLRRVARAPAQGGARVLSLALWRPRLPAHPARAWPVVDHAGVGEGGGRPALLLFRLCGCVARTPPTDAAAQCGRGERAAAWCLRAGHEERGGWTCVMGECGGPGGSEDDWQPRTRSTVCGGCVTCMPI